MLDDGGLEKAPVLPAAARMTSRDALRSLTLFRDYHGPWFFFLRLLISVRSLLLWLREGGRRMHGGLYGVQQRRYALSQPLTVHCGCADSSGFALMVFDHVYFQVTNALCFVHLFLDKVATLSYVRSFPNSPDNCPAHINLSW